jgi:hypothetical protein
LSSIKENLYDENKIENTQSYIEIQKKVAENVKGVHIIDDDKVTNDGQPNRNNDQNLDEPKNLGQTDNDLDYNDNDDDKQEYSNIPYSLQTSYKIDTPEDIVRDWENLHNTYLPKKLREFALLIAAIHLDEKKE